VSGVAPDHLQSPCTTAKYYIRSELKQFGKYLTGIQFVCFFICCCCFSYDNIIVNGISKCLIVDAAELLLRVYDTDINRLLGNAKVQNLSTLSINSPIKGYQSVFTNKGDKLGEVFIALRLILPESKSIVDDSLLIYVTRMFVFST
jgi:hypothetical protein